jgi:hypothetical protein
MAVERLDIAAVFARTERGWIQLSRSMAAQIITCRAHRSPRSKHTAQSQRRPRGFFRTIVTVPQPEHFRLP